jgi:hypothetical protein
VLDDRAQPLSCPGQSRHHRADRHAEDARRLLVGKILDADQQQQRLLLFRQLLERRQRVSRLERRFLARRRLAMVDLVDLDLCSAPPGLPVGVDVQVAQDGEQPGAQLAIGAP